MTVLGDVRVALAALLTTGLPGVRVAAFPCGEDSPLKECVHLGNTESRFEWRSIGRAANNRTEDIEIDIVVHTFREASDQRDAASAAVTRCEELLELVETAVVTDAAGAFTVGGTISQGRISGWTVRPLPRDSGWACIATARMSGRNHP